MKLTAGLLKSMVLSHFAFVTQTKGGNTLSVFLEKTQGIIIGIKLKTIYKGQAYVMGEAVIKLVPPSFPVFFDHGFFCFLT